VVGKASKPFSHTQRARHSAVEGTRRARVTCCAANACSHVAGKSHVSEGYGYDRRNAGARNHIHAKWMSLSDLAAKGSYLAALPHIHSSQTRLSTIKACLSDPSEYASRDGKSGKGVLALFLFQGALRKLNKVCYIGVILIGIQAKIKVVCFIDYD